MRKLIPDFFEDPQYLHPEKIWRRLPQPFRLAVVSTFLLGLIVHLYMFSNLLLNHDAAYGIVSSGSSLPSGRWSQKFFASLSWFYETPVVIVVLALVALALCAGLTVYVLDIHSSACVLLVSGFMVSFPIVACTFTYMFTADAYFIAALLHVAAVYITKKFRYGWIAAVLCIAAGLGIYQAYIGCTVALFLLDCIVALFSDTSAKDILKRGLAYVAIILAGLVLYRVILTYLLWKNDIVLTSYQNMNRAIDSGVLDYLRAAPKAYRQVYQFFWSTSYLVRPMLLLQKVMFILAIGCLLFLTLLKKIYKDPLRLLLLILCVALLPAAINLISIIGAGLANVHILMKYPYVFIYIFALKLFEMTVLEVRSSRFRRSRHAVISVCLIACAGLIWTNFCVCNMAYLSLQLTVETYQSIGIRVLSRLEALDGYVPGKTPVLLENNMPAYKRLGVDFPKLAEMTGFTAVILDSYSGPSVLKNLCGAGSFRSANSEQTKEVKASGLLSSMPAFPAKDSIQFYNGIVVVKLS